jgi:hypothetical protein
MMLLLGVLLATVLHPIPSAMLGTWSSGSCSDPSKLLLITATTVKMGTGPAASVVYVPDDDGAGNGAIHWTAEGSVDNFVLVTVDSTNKIVYNAQGYHMPGAVAYTHCDS